LTGSTAFRPCWISSPLYLPSGKDRIEEDGVSFVSEIDSAFAERALQTVGASQLPDDLKASLRIILNFVEKRTRFHLAEGLLKSSEVRIEEMSKMLADIFRDPLDDCLCRVNASMLLASKRTADRTRKSIIVTRNLSIQIWYV
jgi:hypothetical protein